MRDFELDRITVSSLYSLAALIEKRVEAHSILDFPFVLNMTAPAFLIAAPSKPVLRLGDQ